MEIKEPRTRLRLQDVQNLVLWVLAEGHNPQFAFIKNKALVPQVVLLYVPGLDEPLLKAKSHLLHTFSFFLGPSIPVMARSSTQRPMQTVSALFTIPLTQKAQKKKATERSRAGRQPPFKPSHYVATLAEMEANNFPLPVISETGELVCPPGYVATQPAGGVFTFPWV